MSNTTLKDSWKEIESKFIECGYSETEIVLAKQAFLLAIIDVNTIILRALTTSSASALSEALQDMEDEISAMRLELTASNIN